MEKELFMFNFTLKTDYEIQNKNEAQPPNNNNNACYCVHVDRYKQIYEHTFIDM